MPIYEYQCEGCQSVFEEWQSGFEEKDMECPECGLPAKRLISHSAFHLKGGGWYADGYGGKNAASAPGEAAEPAASGKENGNGNGNGDGNGAKPEKAATSTPKGGTSETPSAGSAS